MPAARPSIATNITPSALALEAPLLALELLQTAHARSLQESRFADEHATSINFPTHSAAGRRFESSQTRANLMPRSLAPCNDRGRERMFAVRFDGGGSPRAARCSVTPFSGNHTRQARFAFGQGAGLVDDQRVAPFPFARSRRRL